MKELIDKLIKEGYLKTPLIIKAFKKIKREDFVLEDLKSEADINAPLPIGYGQTISQPLTVAFMLELLHPQPGDKILDIGAGSGWQTAMLAYIVSQHGNPKSEILNPKQIPNSNNQNPKQTGRVFAIERIPELVEFGKKNVGKYNFVEKGIVEFICGDASQKATFDPIRDEISNGVNKIIAAAATERIPETWKEQLKIGGRLVTPVQSSIWLLVKKSKNEFDEKEFPGFAFVPLIGE